MPVRMTQQQYTMQSKLVGETKQNYNKNNNSDDDYKKIYIYSVESGNERKITIRSE